jgi:ankyrin repeat protein
MKYLVDTGQANLSDVTLGNHMPIDHAIESGNVQLVGYLLRCRKRLANRPFGIQRTTPIQAAVLGRNIEMCRLLLHYGADCDHISLFGWNAISYLWVPKDHATHDGTLKSTIEFLKMFYASSISFDLSVRDIWGWTALHRAAAEDQAEEVKIILDLSDVQSE